MAAAGNIVESEAKPAKKKPAEREISIFASAKLAAVLLTIVAATVLLGAWCPQESQVGQEKIIEQFGEDTGMNLIRWGIADIFHTPFFLCLIGLLTLNITVASVQRVFPKLRVLKLPLPYLSESNIAKQPVHETRVFQGDAQACLKKLQATLRRNGYRVSEKEDMLACEFGKFAKLAATVTHIGLLSLLVGVTITSWTGFSGFKPVLLGDSLSFKDSEHSKLWIGKLPSWTVHVDGTRREDYATGEAKQWYSDLTVNDESGKVLLKKKISVNDPLSFDGVDVYQSSWGMDHIVVSFNGHKRDLPLRPMGKLYAAFLPLDETTILIFSVKNAEQPLRLFAKSQKWDAPKLLCEIPPSGTVKLGSVTLRYEEGIPITGLQYKADPGLPITYIAFAFIIVGVSLATIPHRQLWAQAKPSQNGTFTLSLGGRSNKAKVGFERFTEKIIRGLKSDFVCQDAPKLETEEAAREPALSASAQGASHGDKDV